MRHHYQKKSFYSRLNIKDITDADYKHAKRVCKTKNLGEYHDLYAQSVNIITR